MYQPSSRVYFESGQGGNVQVIIQSSSDGSRTECQVHHAIMMRNSEFFQHALFNDVSRAIPIRVLGSLILIIHFYSKDHTPNGTVIISHRQPALVLYMFECIYTRNYCGGRFLELVSMRTATSDNIFILHIEMLRIARLYKVGFVEQRAYWSLTRDVKRHGRSYRPDNRFRQAMQWLYSFPPGSDHDIRFQITLWLHYWRASFTPAGFENIQQTGAAVPQFGDELRQRAREIVQT